MTQRLAGKTALITAAGQGIGLATAELFATRGRARDRHRYPHRLARRQAGRSAQARRARRRGDQRAGRRNSAPIDVLFNCAGFVHAGSILDASEEDWDFAFNLNAKAMYRTIRAFLPAMLENGGGSIINMSSAASSVKGVPNRFAYGASKAAVIGLTKAVAADFVTRGVRCNAICPGTVASPSLQQRIAAQAQAQGATRRRRCRRRSSRASRWAASASRKKSRRWRCISRPTSRRSRPARRM